MCAAPARGPRPARAVKVKATAESNILFIAISICFLSVFETSSPRRPPFAECRTGNGRILRLRIASRKQLWDDGRRCDAPMEAVKQSP